MDSEMDGHISEDLLHEGHLEEDHLDYDTIVKDIPKLPIE
jgi:hypothetical protein